MKDVVGLLGDLIRTPSVNPDDNPDPAVSGEHAIGHYVAGVLEDAGFSIEWHEFVPGRPNLVARIGSRNPRRTLLFEAHLDTVGIGWMTIPPFKPECRDGRLYGRGACDTKGPMAAALTAFDPVVLKKISDAGCSIIFVGAMGEEKGNQGALDLVAHGLGADEAIVLEPTDLKVVHAHKGTLWVRMTVKGMSAHGATPAAGINAVEGAWAAVTEIRKLTDRCAELSAHPVLGSPTLNIGKFTGGSAVNVVPADCVVELDRRTLPGEDMTQLCQDWKVVLDRLQTAGSIVDYKLDVMTAHEAYCTDARGTLVSRLMNSLARTGCRAESAGASWYSDAGAFSRTCKEVVVFGPGSIHQAHTAEEYIEVAELQAGSRVIRDLLNQWADEA